MSQARALRCVVCSALGALLGVSLLLGGRAWCLAEADGPLVVYVRPDRLHAEDADGSGGKDRPFLTIDYAIRSVEKLLEGKNHKAVRFELLRGQYRNLEGGESFNVFPLVPPVGFDSVEFVASGGVGSVRIENVDPNVEVFKIRSEEFEKAPRFSFSGLQIFGGRQAFTVFDTVSRDAKLRIEDCWIEGQSAHGLEAAPLKGSLVTIEVKHCVFRRSSEGIYVSSPESAALSLTVEDCQFHEMRRYSPRKLLGAGIDLYLELQSELSVRIERCIFRGVASAVQVTECASSDAFPVKGGALNFNFSGNVVNGLPDPAEPLKVQVENGLYLSTREFHLNNISILSNTFVGIHQYVIYGDNLEELVAEGNGLTPYRFTNNICWQIGGESEFYDEVFKRTHEDRSIVFPTVDSAIRHNLLEKSSLTTIEGGQNHTGDPRFEAPAAFDFRLTALSDAIDRGIVADALEIKTDFAGNCRRMSTVCDTSQSHYRPDLGAYEYPGHCDESLVLFVRGDCDSSSGTLEITDAVTVFSYLFLGKGVPACPDACDTNDDAVINLTDGVYLLNFLFSGGSSPASPFPQAGSDAGGDCLPDCK